MFAVSPEPVERIAAFTGEHGITFPVLADADSTVIRRYGIQSTLIDQGERLYGLPFPGSYVADGEGRVVAKFFRRRYQERAAPEVVIRDGLHLPVDLLAHPSASDGTAVSAVLASPRLTFMQPTALLVRIDLPEGLHVYGLPVPDGYIPTTVAVTATGSVRVGEPVYPQTRPYRVEGVDDEFHVFDGRVEIAVPLSPAELEAETVALAVDVRYQACDDRMCFLPRTVHLEVEAPVGRLNRPQRP